MISQTTNHGAIQSASIHGGLDEVARLVDATRANGS